MIEAWALDGPRRMFAHRWASLPLLTERQKGHNDYGCDRDRHDQPCAIPGLPGVLAKAAAPSLQATRAGRHPRIVDWPVAAQQVQHRDVSQVVAHRAAGVGRVVLFLSVLVCSCAEATVVAQLDLPAAAQGDFLQVGPAAGAGRRGAAAAAQGPLAAPDSHIRAGEGAAGTGVGAFAG